MEIARSDIVESIAGRDKGKLFIVLDADGEYVFLTDGKLRRVERPKRKKLKHVRYHSPSGGHAAMKLHNGEKVTNNEIRRALNEFTAQNGGL